LSRSSFSRSSCAVWTVLPPARAAAVQGEHADHPPEDDDRRRDHRPCPQLGERRAAAERLVLELRGAQHVVDDDRAALPRREVRRGQPRGGVADPRQLGRMPFGRERHALLPLAEPDRRARQPERLRSLGDGDPQHGVEVELGSDLPRDARDEPLTVDRALELGNRP
jgi:hypothetical protein